jgi:hypothetical protein
MAIARVAGQEKPHTTVVGGGISGLYAAYLLALEGFTVDLYELNPHFLGGKIATRRFPETNPEFFAEFGPMRFEVGLQDRLRILCEHLRLKFKTFSETSSPAVPNKYEMTAIEGAFTSAADLHLWAVLKMFFGREPTVMDHLDTIEREVSESAIGHDDKAKQIGCLQLRYLQCYVDKQVFCVADSVSGGVKPAHLEARDEALDSLRRQQRLWGDNPNTDMPLLRDIGLWHGLSEVLTPGAVARIRDSGTFYHCVANNPSAVEWGIFWLRQASVLGQLFTLDADHGVSSLVDQLKKKITRCTDESGRKLVTIRPGFEVLQVEPGKRPTEVVLRIEQISLDGEKPHTFNIRTDHVILAVPRQPLLKLSEHFPLEVVDRIEGVAPLHLLKAFVVTSDPWWPPKFKAQSYAWRVPTRELHFYHQRDEPNGPKGPNGMIMLYTDEPAIRYWDVLIPKGDRSAVFWRVFGESDTALQEVQANRFGLLEMLIRRLLVLPHPGLAGGLEDRKKQFRRALERDAKAVRDALVALENNATGSLFGESERIVELLRSDNPPEGAADAIDKALRLALGELVPREPEDWLDAFRKGLCVRRTGVISTEAVDDRAKHVLAYGIRDWSAPPYGGAAHFWIPGHSWAHADVKGEIIDDPLPSFALRERRDSPENVHICGEAYSGDQGFIEGALDTAERAVRSIIGCNVPTLDVDEDFRQEQEDTRRNLFKKAWAKRQKAPAGACSSWERIVPRLPPLPNGCAAH